MTVPATCPNCGAPASGRFCSGCGTTLAGASCATCSAALSPGARFCHRCGTPVGSAPAPARGGIAAVLPWALAAIALVALIALVVGQRFGARGAAAASPVAEATPAPTGAQPRAPDISQMTPEQQAERLYDRIMREFEAGQTDNVRTFMPMAVAAYERLSPLSLDQRYDLARIGEVGGDVALMKAQTDTILRQRDTHLLGLILAAKVARLAKDDAKAATIDARLIAAEAKERAAALPEYLLHKQDIDDAVAQVRSRSP